MGPYKVIHTTPSVSVYRDLRVKSGLSAKSEAASIAGLPNSLFSVQIILESDSNGDSVAVVGMGRVIGDGGCFYQVVDIAVDPAHQGKGLGKLLVKEIKKWLDANVPESGYVSLIGYLWVARTMIEKASCISGKSVSRWESKQPLSPVRVQRNGPRKCWNVTVLQRRDGAHLIMLAASLIVVLVITGARCAMKGVESVMRSSNQAKASEAKDAH